MSKLWKIYFAKQALKDAKKLQKSNLKNKAQEVLEIVTHNPFADSPPYEKLVGDLTGAYSRRINIQHRLVYQVDKTNKRVKVLRMWSHYE